MMKKNRIIRFLAIILPALMLQTIIYAQTTGGETINREIKLYNPFKPTLQDANKRLFFPVMSDSTGKRKDVGYTVTPGSFTPRYKVSEIKAATIDPDPLPKLYKGFVKAGFGNYISPLAELSISNERSKKSAVGFYAKHFSSHGMMKLGNDAKVPGGFMDNDAILYGKKFFRRSVLEGSTSFSYDTRFAYGYITDSVPKVDLDKDDVNLNFLMATGDVTYYSQGTDSSDFSYDFGLQVRHFRSTPDLWFNNVDFKGMGSMDAFGFHTGAKLTYDIYMFDELADANPKHFFSINPFISKKGAEWKFKLGLRADVIAGTDHDAVIPDETETRVFLFPDVMFGFDIVPGILNFKLALDGDVEKNDAAKGAAVNPWIMTDGSLFRLNPTINKMRISAGFNGSVTERIEYRAGASYTFVEDLLMYKSKLSFETLTSTWLDMGNYFTPLYDNGEMLKISGEVNALITDKLSLRTSADYFSYNLSDNDYAWNKPDWTAAVTLNYNLRNKIMADIGFNAISARKGLVGSVRDLDPEVLQEVDLPMHINMSIGAEYRYTKILSFWARMTNIGFNTYNEFAYYPSRRFLFLAGFTYSL